MSQEAEQRNHPTPDGGWVLNPDLNEPIGTTTGSLRSRDIKLVQLTFGVVEPMAQEAAKLFYDRLFELDPGLKPLFKGEFVEQGRKLMATIKVAINGLTKLEQIVPAVRALGARHVDYGVQDSHYETVGVALLWTLEKALGPAFTDEVRDAWAATYSLIANVMKDAAQAVD